MPIYEPDHVEYSINTSHIRIILDDGQQLPAYLAHPQIGGRYPGIVLIHDWWGLNEIVRRIANFFGQTGYYVIVPDLFNSQVAATPKDAITLVEELGDHGYPRIDSALTVLENHHQCNRSVAAVGIGMGGSMAFEAAITRTDLEAAVTFSGFPHRQLGRFASTRTPICAFYGADEPHIKQQSIQKMRAELQNSALKEKHQVVVVEGVGHEFFHISPTPVQSEQGRQALKHTLRYLDSLLARPITARHRHTY